MTKSNLIVTEVKSVLKINDLGERLFYTKLFIQLIRINLLVLPLEDTLTFFLVIDVATVVLSPVFPGEEAFAMHHVVFPLTRILSPIVPLICAMTLHAIVDESALEIAPILPFEVTLAVLFTSIVLTFVHGTV